LHFREDRKPKIEQQPCYAPSKNSEEFFNEFGDDILRKVRLEAFTRSNENATKGESLQGHHGHRVGNIHVRKISKSTSERISPSKNTQ